MNESTAASEPENSDELNKKPEGIGKRLRILLVENNEVDQLVAIAMFMKLGHRIDVAENDKEVFDLLDKKTYDLILMDLDLPKSADGFAITKRIKENPVYSRTPVIALTGSPNPEDTKKCFNIGMQGFIPKPIELDSIQKTLTGISNVG